MTSATRPTGDTVRVGAPTEARNPRTADLDMLPTLELLRRLNDEDHRVPEAVASVLPGLATAVDAAVERLAGGGRLHYFGAGTSGRIALADAAELPPTFCFDADRVVAYHAGGDGAVVRAHEGAEDDAALGAHDAAGVGAGDVVVALAASGRTPYVAGALAAARAVGAYTVLVSANPDAPLAELADVHVGPDTGPEALAGSTRLKAASAQKLVLNSFSTAVMVRLGKTYSNLMVDVSPANAKLRGRVLQILEEASGATPDACAVALADADGDTKTALVCLLAEVDAPTARSALADAGGIVRSALDRLDTEDGS